jgi:hypothetical protein
MAMWLVARFLPASLFSLRSSTATSSGGRTNLVPTMYAIKLALVDAAFRAGNDGEAIFELVKPLTIRIEPPPQAVVSNTLIKVQREPKERKSGPAFIPSVAYREFCYFSGDLGIAFDTGGVPPERITELRGHLPLLSYFGKRGSFFQLRDLSELAELPASFGHVPGDGHDFSPDMIIQYLDDIAPTATFDRINTFSGSPARVQRDRILVPVALPYRRVASSRGYTWYERTA